MNGKGQTSFAQNKNLKRIFYLVLIAILLYVAINASSVANRLGVMFVSGEIGPLMIIMAVFGVAFVAYTIARDIGVQMRIHSTNVNRDFNQTRDRRRQDRLATKQRPVEVESIPGTNVETA